MSSLPNWACLVMLAINAYATHFLAGIVHCEPGSVVPLVSLLRFVTRLVMHSTTNRTIAFPLPDTCDLLRPPLVGGGAHVERKFTWAELAPYMVFDDPQNRMPSDAYYDLVSYTPLHNQDLILAENPDSFSLMVALEALVPHFNYTELKSISTVHGIKVPRGSPRQDVETQLRAHVCVDCEPHRAVFTPKNAAARRRSVLTPRQEYMDDATKNVKPFSLEEIEMFGTIAPDCRGAYALGARLTKLEPAGDSLDRCDNVGDGTALVCYAVPWMRIAKKAGKTAVSLIATLHGLKPLARTPKADTLLALGDHACTDTCPRYRATFHPVRTERKQPAPTTAEVPPTVILEPGEDTNIKPYPPPPLSDLEKITIIREFCDDIRPSCFEEAGCAVCGQLTLLTELKPIESLDCPLDPLVEPGVARQERLSPDEPITYDAGPVIDKSVDTVCAKCASCLAQGRRPVNALANGLWVGEVPSVLSDLSYAEQCLIARARTNRCVVRVGTIGYSHSKMTANAISFALPTLKVYHSLPPPQSEMNEVMAFIFTGINPPTEDDLERTPMLVRRSAVGRALEWLKLNHADYTDLQIDHITLNSYPVSGPIVRWVHRPEAAEASVNVAATSMHETDAVEEPVESDEGGKCPFVVSGLIGSHLETMSTAARKAAAVHHLSTGGSALAVGQADAPESKYHNPQLYPQLYPWLFPYGAGGLGNPRLMGLVAESTQKTWLLMYHDKRFQTDSRFVIVAFNDEQIKRARSGSMIVMKRANFTSVAARIHNINPAVAKEIAVRMQEGETVKPETEEEKSCFALMDQIDHVGSSVYGSLAGKKNMRSEIWSLIAYRGAPSWFITLSPADNKHPICIYWADKKTSFSPEIREYKERARLVSNNPVAGARFFNFMVLLLIKHLLRWADPGGRAGAFGHTAAYYGTVEQQGRMTLHLHMLIWIICALSPQQVRDRIMAKDSDFVKELIAYLEGCQTGDFMTGTMDDMKARFRTKDSKSPNDPARPDNMQQTDGLPNETDVKSETPVHDPTQALPRPPPDARSQHADAPSCDCTCDGCFALSEWTGHYKDTVDNILFRSNVHTCYYKRDVITNGVRTQHVFGKGCLNKDHVCTGRFPRQLFKSTVIDTDGHINLKKNESWINTVNELMVYLFGCNTDCTSLSSGTAVKASAGYIADYISKFGLKTYQIFSSIYDVFERNPDIKDESKDENDAARKLILKMANSLTSKIEIGGPMAAMYLLGHPDHYSSHDFVTLYWRPYVSYVLEKWDAITQTFETSGDPMDCEGPHLSSSFESPTDDGDGTDSDVDSGDTTPSADTDTVTVSRSHGRILSKSNVDDYVMRPAELDTVCLYDWIQCSVRKYVVGIKKPSLKLLKYLEGHPLRDTHRVLYDVGRMQLVVPNIIGPHLPRSDSDDRNYYCCTMLTLFSPWRVATDLRSSAEDWESAFDRHSFAPRHLKIIQNFMIRHECYDSRDDYHAQLRNQVAAQYNGDEDAGSDDEGEELPNEDDHFDMDVDPKDEEIGTWSQKKVDQMKEVEVVLHSAGWHVDGASSTASMAGRAFAPERSFAPSKWKDVVASERRKVMNARLATAVPNQYALEDDMDIDVQVINDARVVPGSYFHADFNLNDADVSAQLNETVQLYSLNEEQTRAFRIVANHSVSPRADQLLMYIGGMGAQERRRL
ncbi:hypothetical protein D9611_014251 [Ephemerocybe angulata]|uniref:Helitron helicase-like domain-containing protein n=1 Tax=Ephemerocybe angulata TaxID=980116 RepID=A0A8H5BST9_9AGAR|nr:hypothetical protein D9611_014251 [Tulosesus angulatus]